MRCLVGHKEEGTKTGCGESLRLNNKVLLFAVLSYQYKNEGEKPTRLFCSLEKHNAVQKHIPKLLIEKNEINEEITDQKAIENEIFEYYKNLFAENPPFRKLLRNF